MYKECLFLAYCSLCMGEAIKGRLKHKNARFDRTNSMKKRFYFGNWFSDRTIIQCSTVPIFKMTSQPYKRAGKNGSGTQNSDINRTRVPERTVPAPKFRYQPYKSAEKNGSGTKIQISTVRECQKERFRFQNSNLNRTSIIKSTDAIPKLKS